MGLLQLALGEKEGRGQEKVSEAVALSMSSALWFKYSTCQGVAIF